LQFLLIVTDAALVAGCAYVALASLPSVLILFGFEYAILGVHAVATLARYTLHLIDARIDGTWQASRQWLQLR
jgi:hypothetical protein